MRHGRAARSRRLQHDPARRRSGQSTEPFTRNNLSNMMADTRAALAYARGEPDTDPKRTGIVGYSMGARVAMLVLPDGFAGMRAARESHRSLPPGASIRPWAGNGSMTWKRTAQ